MGGAGGICRGLSPQRLYRSPEGARPPSEQVAGALEWATKLVFLAVDDSVTVEYDCGGGFKKSFIGDGVLKISFSSCPPSLDLATSN